jgi:hypothetical protein
MTNKKASENASDALLVELISESLHLVIEELVRWKDIIGPDFRKYQLQKARLSSDREQPLTLLH